MDGEFDAAQGGDGKRDLIAYARRQTDRARKVGHTPALNESMPPADLVPGHVILEEVHRGGQGVVYKAIQAGTKREVAVKVLHDGVFAGPAERARFDREVEILGGLRHPNIVSIHVGGSVGGHRYFVMDYVDGVSLDVHLSGGDRPIQEVLGLFLKICHAISAAHLRGVIHRDLKPSNIRVDAAGEPHILDFGLAQWSKGTRPRVTETGAFVGSLPWSAPEQARGASDAIDIRTDVYSLGVLLFHMLTSEFPYHVVGSMPEVLDHILNAEPKRPSTLRREINDELDTMVLKCLAKDPERRYQSGGELARDVERFLAGEPIEAKRDSTWYVLTKSARRHRTVAIGLAVLLLLTFGYAASLTVLYRRAAVAEQSAVRSEQRSQSYAADAREKFHLATGALSFVVREVSDRLRDVAGASDARRVILEGAFDKLQALTAGHTDDPLLQAQIAQAYTQLGDIAMSLGDVDQAAEQFQTALALREQLAKADTDNEPFLVDLSMSLVRVGDVARARRNPDSASELYERALAIDERLVADHPENNHYRDNLAWSYDRLGALAQRRNNLEPARDYHEKQYEIMTELVATEPNNAVRVYGLYTACGHLQALANLVGDRITAARHARKTLDLAIRMTALEPANPLFARRLVNAHILVGCITIQEGQLQIAAEHARQALVIAERIVAADPDVLENRFALANALGTMTCLGIPIDDVDQIAEYGQRWYEQAERLAADATYDIDPGGQRRLLDAAAMMAHIARRQGREDDARRYLERALSIGAQAQADPDPSPIVLLQYAGLLAGVRQPDLRDPETAVAAAERAVEIAGELPDILLVLGRVYCATADNGQGIDTLHRALSKLPPEDSSLRRHIEAAIAACSSETNAPPRARCPRGGGAGSR